MWVFRLALTVIFLVLVLLVGVIEHVITWAVGKFNPDACLRMRSSYIRRGLKLVWLAAAGKTTVLGLDNIPTDRPVLFVGNHRSMLDVVGCGSLIPFPVGFISKIELEKIPLLRMQMRDINCLFLDRKDDRQALKVILKAIELVKGGQSMFIFPEGTRNKTPQNGLLPFKEGSFKLAEKTGCPIIPVAIHNTDNIFENHLPWVKACHVTLQFGEPILVNELSKEERKFLGAYTQKKIETMLTALPLPKMP
jgi:1-acyl-sn-glycerol-3-phosphate acyltransferase